MDTFRIFQAGIDYAEAYTLLIHRMEKYKPGINRKHYNELLHCIRDFGNKADAVVRMAAELEKNRKD